MTPGYFEAMGLRLVRGRVLTAEDREGTLPVAVVNQTMAERYWPGEDALAVSFMMGTDDKPWLTDRRRGGQVRHNAVIEEPRAEMYVAHAQLPEHIGRPRAASPWSSGPRASRWRWRRSSGKPCAAWTATFQSPTSGRWRT